MELQSVHVSEPTVSLATYYRAKKTQPRLILILPKNIRDKFMTLCDPHLGMSMLVRKRAIYNAKCATLIAKTTTDRVMLQGVQVSHIAKRSLHYSLYLLLFLVFELPWKNLLNHVFHCRWLISAFRRTCRAQTTCRAKTHPNILWYFQAGTFRVFHRPVCWWLWSHKGKIPLAWDY